MEIHIKGAKKSQLMLQDTFTICLKKKKSLSLSLSQNHRGTCKGIAEV